MFDKVIDRINLGIKERVIAFFILWFAIYGSVWTILEPLDFPILKNQLIIWRILFICGTFLLNVIIYFLFLFRRKLESIGLESGNTDLMSTVVSDIRPTFTIQNDGFHGKLLVVKANSSKDFLDWHIKASALKANFITIIYKPENDLIFYARVNVLSKNKKGSSKKWLRFEPNRSLPQSTADDEEMGVPVNVTEDNGLQRVNVNLSKTIINAFGSYGWIFDKVVIIRARGSGKIKNIILK